VQAEHKGDTKGGSTVCQAQQRSLPYKVSSKVGAGAVYSKLDARCWEALPICQAHVLCACTVQEELC
jgi:hypothetical protein